MNNIIAGAAQFGKRMILEWPLIKSTHKSTLGQSTDHLSIKRRQKKKIASKPPTQIESIDFQVLRSKAIFQDLNTYGLVMVLQKMTAQSH